MGMSAAREHIGNDEEPTVNQKSNSRLCLYFAFMQILVIVRYGRDKPTRHNHGPQARIINNHPSTHPHTHAHRHTHIRSRVREVEFRCFGGEMGQRQGGMEERDT